ncbi:nuclear receptor ROR-gamma isoform X1 [Falco biarmicus]|uniref:nuclear receptor ROR-gamma isoform X1 n=1 Tax=Falco cherrug TaxID=345164 RepID=UPI00247AFA0A|nr:nuclear receptor ROR-gamma isoform X1 [Falco cherrug]XP_055553250.1 nuclear receptor ROR-gamma isoform X1 [Falco cherrug]XP_055553251.1 nuclear receptor ROR-gamma isoform X1 [Falco cherrug]XP_056178050.1 nuclear receptor ROR-gamma isoform X1 [Falco biarmicus]XP_056178051.1 nuclear receptor ROR-gamma isoform X1 [Falco biarmicus]XP_056178052.1 nuclear receptor ROR-gamma isoform X1 [Falco biarmicus]
MSRDAVKFGRMSKKQRERLHAEVQQQLEQRQQERAAEGAAASPPEVMGRRGHPLTPASTPGCPGTRHGATDGRAGPMVEAELGRPEGAEQSPDKDRDGEGDRDDPDFYPHPDVSSLLESPTSSGLEIEHLTQNVLKSYRETCQLRAEDLQLRRWDIFSREEVCAYQKKSMEEMWQCCAGRITEAIQYVVEFAKRLRGFMDLCQNDQIVLLKAGTGPPRPLSPAAGPPCPPCPLPWAPLIPLSSSPGPPCPLVLSPGATMSPCPQTSAHLVPCSQPRVHCVPLSPAPGPPRPQPHSPCCPISPAPVSPGHGTLWSHQGGDSPTGPTWEMTVPKGHPNPTGEVTNPRAGAAGAPTQPAAVAPWAPASPVPPSPSRCRAVAGAMEVVLVRMCRAFNSDNRTVFFEGKYASTELFRSLGCHELIGSIFDFAQSLCALHVSESEVAFFSALVLINASRPWLQEPAKVARLQGRLDVAFRLLLRRTRREGLLARLPPAGHLRALCSQHVEQLQAFRRLCPAALHVAFPPLYRELFAGEAETPGAAR